MTNKFPEWVEKLKQGDFLVIVFPYTGDTVYAKVIENNPTPADSIYFGTITVNYSINNSSKHEDLLYDDYSKEPENFDNWHAYRVT